MASSRSSSMAWGKAGDRLLVGLALLHGVLLVIVPSLPLIALGLWWNAQTVSHLAIHRPLFRSRRGNAAFDCWLSVVLGFPQEVWRRRHLAHHGLRVTRRAGALAADLLAVAGRWTALAVWAPDLLFAVHLPGFLLGLGLCAIHGFFEHARGATSHYGRLANLLFFNDGHHVEHHAHPGAHWSDLPRLRRGGARTSRWPAVLRWLEHDALDLLERLVLGSRLLRWFVLGVHQRALRRLLPQLAPARRILIVGGGLFPRTALLLRRLLPHAELTVLDAEPDHLAMARAHLDAGVRFVSAWYDSRDHDGYDAVVLPLAYRGDRGALYAQPPAPLLLVHDWLWRPRGASAVVSLLLLKRLNLVTGTPLPLPTVASC